MSAFSALGGLLARFEGPTARSFTRNILVAPTFLTGGGRAFRRTVRRIRAVRPEAGSGRSEASLVVESAELYTRFLLAMMAHPAEEALVGSVELPILEDIERARRDGNGVILALSNYGLVGHGIWALIRRIDVLVPVLNPAHLDRLSPRDREKFIQVGRSALPCARALSRNGVVAAIVDMDFLPRGEPTLFFGAPAPIGYAASKLSIMTGAPVIPAFVEPGGAFARFEGAPPIRPDGKSVADMNLALAKALEDRIARNPGRWMVYLDFWNVSAMRRMAAAARFFESPR